ncbi:response regulator [Marisediminicola sp. LYQ134]|uniref:response regulator n=1 Tax=unclassified Marisediminicola TaxID=2618316 RepID=UPI003982E6BA
MSQGTTIATDEVSREPVTVLVVEDSDDQRLLLRRLFERHGCRVIDAESAEAAIELYSTVGAGVDLAVVDLLLPGMTGWDLTARIRADLPGCPVAITSVLDPEQYPCAEASLVKPVSRARVRDVLERCVDRWQTP